MSWHRQARQQIDGQSSRRRTFSKAASKAARAALLAATSLSTLCLLNLPDSAAHAASAVPFPLAKPGLSASSRAPSKILPQTDAGRLKSAFDAGARGRWFEVRMLTQKVNDPAAKLLLTWWRLRTNDSGANLAEITAFLDQNPDWPSHSRLRRNAEKALLDYPMSDKDLINWFATETPLSGEGKLKLADALFRTGKITEAQSWVARAWVDHNFGKTREAEVLAQYRPHLTQAVHEERLARLLWEKRYSNARRMLHLVNADAKAIAKTRISLMRRNKSASTSLLNLPKHLRNRPDILYDEARYLRRKGQEDQALPILLTTPGQPHQQKGANQWWVERKIMARKALAKGRYQEAYKLAKEHAHVAGLNFADGEFLAGWIALQYLNQPDIAAQHFKTLTNGVKTPISKSRGLYWQARAADALGQKANATSFFQQAAQFKVTFYGQLAQSTLDQKLGTRTKLALSTKVIAAPNTRQMLESDLRVKALRLLFEIGDNKLARTFAYHLSKDLKSADELASFSDLLLEEGHPNLSVRTAKVAARRNIVLPHRSYPTSVLPSYKKRGPRVEEPLVYGLSRQESEFNPQAISHAGARGLMQLMPGTARIVARQINVPYRKSRLTSDPAYNAMLGSAHLGDLVNQFQGSYIMTIAAYNAGARRVDEWVDKYGDPRSSAVDPIDWVENIPFTETRNYVQRVLENVQVYRDRLSQGAVPLRLAQDLNRYTGPAFNAARPTPAIKATFTHSHTPQQAYQGKAVPAARPSKRPAATPQSTPASTAPVVRIAPPVATAVPTSKVPTLKKPAPSTTGQMAPIY
ncbi:MAG: transglycosylase SLT domain-containing protein, partial [Parvibaculaceae bacterium]|nr:transglycosylase SLT domain-containing protein [Parvibaculaceae bacterium]